MTELPHRCTQEKEIKRLTDSLDDLDHVIRGNGQPGMRTDVALIKTAVEGHLKDHEWFRRMLIGAVCTQGVTLLIAGATFIIKLKGAS